MTESFSFIDDNTYNIAVDLDEGEGERGNTNQQSSSSKRLCPQPMIGEELDKFDPTLELEAWMNTDNDADFYKALSGIQLKDGNPNTFVAKEFESSINKESQAQYEEDHKRIQQAQLPADIALGSDSNSSSSLSSDSTPFLNIGTSRSSFDANEIRDENAFYKAVDDIEGIMCLGIYDGIVYSTTHNDNIHRFTLTALQNASSPTPKYNVMGIPFPVHSSVHPRCPCLMYYEFPDFIARETSGITTLIYLKENGNNGTTHCLHCDNFSGLTTSCSNKCFSRASQYSDLLKLHQCCGLSFKVTNYAALCNGVRAQLPFVLKVAPCVVYDIFGDGRYTNTFQGTFNLNVDSITRELIAVNLEGGMKIDLCKFCNYINIFRRASFQDHIVNFYRQTGLFDVQQELIRQRKTYTSYIVLHGHERKFFEYLHSQMNANDLLILLNAYSIDVKTIALNCCMHCLFADLNLAPTHTCACIGPRLSAHNLSVSDIHRLRAFRLYQLFFFGTETQGGAVYPILNERLCISTQMEFLGATKPTTHALEVCLNWNKNPNLFKEPVVLIKPTQIEGYIRYLLKHATLHDQSLNVVTGLVTQYTYECYNAKLFLNNHVLPKAAEVNIGENRHIKIKSLFHKVVECLNAQGGIETLKTPQYIQACNQLIEVMNSYFRLYVIEHNAAFGSVAFPGSMQSIFFGNLFNSVFFYPKDNIRHVNSMNSNNALLMASPSRNTSFSSLPAFNRQGIPASPTPVFVNNNSSNTSSNISGSSIGGTDNKITIRMITPIRTGMGGGGGDNDNDNGDDDDDDVPERRIIDTPLLPSPAVPLVAEKRTVQKRAAAIIAESNIAKTASRAGASTSFLPLNKN